MLKMSLEEMKARMNEIEMTEPVDDAEERELNEEWEALNELVEEEEEFNQYLDAGEPYEDFLYDDYVNESILKSWI